MPTLLRCLLLLLLAAPAAAQVGAPLNRTGSGARAAGMGNAFVALSDDGTAATWNPAGLARLRRPEVSLVGFFERSYGTSEGFRTLEGAGVITPARTVTDSAAPDFASLAVPFSLAGRRATIQAGWRRLYDLTFEYSGSAVIGPIVPGTFANVPLTFRRRSDGAMDVTSGAFAVALGGVLSVGATVDVWRGSWDDRLRLEEVAGGFYSFVTEDVHTTVRGTTWAIGALAAWPRVSLGAVFKAPFDGKVDRDFQVDSNLAAAFAGAVQDQPTHVPASIALGVGWTPDGGRWRFAFDATYDAWSDFNVRLPGAEQEVNFFDSLPEGLSGTRDTISLAAGAERLLSAGALLVPVRAGLSYEPQGGRDPLTRDPVSYLVVAFGAGVNTNTLKLDAAVQRRSGSWQSGQVYRPVTALTGGVDAFGRLTTNEWLVKLSLIVRLAGRR